MGWLKKGIENFLQTAWKEIKNKKPSYNRKKHLIGMPLIGTGGGGNQNIFFSG